MKDRVSILTFVIIGVFLIMSIVVIPSKHIYGEPQYNTSNNIINGVDFDLSSLNEVKDSIIFTSTPLYCNEERTYIGNNAGVNEEQYDVFGDLFDFTYWFQFNFELDLRQVDAVFIKNIDNIGITIEENRKNYIFNTDSGYKQGTYPDTTNTIKLKYVEQELPYHKYAYGYGGDDIFSAKIVNNILKIRAQTQYSYRGGNAIPTGEDISESFVQDFRFSITKNTYTSQSTQYRVGDESDVALESNELMSYDTKIGKRTIGESISVDIIENYQKGKKRISLKVGYGDYYYQDGTPYGGVAGAKKLLQVGDIVQPMQWKNGVDVPFAIKNDGSPVIFEITSAELDASGAPKLTLELLEKTS